jgi:hypothetical protein
MSDFLEKAVKDHDLQTWQNGTVYARDGKGGLTFEVLGVYDCRFKGTDFIANYKLLIEELAEAIRGLQRSGADGNPKKSAIWTARRHNASQIECDGDETCPHHLALQQPEYADIKTHYHDIELFELEEV